MAREKYARLGSEPLSYRFPEAYGDRPVVRAHHKRPVVGVLREKGSNSEREMAYAFHRVGLRVRDIHMSDLITGKEDLRAVDMLVFVGGFSHADVLGAAKGWAFSFLHNPKAHRALTTFYKRANTLSLGVCNGCQLMLRLSLIDPLSAAHPMVGANASKKFECHFTDLTIEENSTVLLGGLSGCRLGVWSAYAEGRFYRPGATESQVVARYAASSYPRNPNGSEDDIASLASKDGRHLAIMPHIERSLFPWNWAYYPREKRHDAVSPWVEAFYYAKDWLVKNAD